MNALPRSCAECDNVSIEIEHGCAYYYCTKRYQYVDKWKATTERDYICPLIDKADSVAE